MKNQTLRTVAVGATLASALFAQNNQRRATMVGGGAPDRGKCTVEIVVDGAAQVEFRGASATLRTVSGQPAQWRRFECTAALPDNPANFRFSGVDGRGRQDLIRDPRNGGVAIVQIEDRDGGSEGYTFDINWGGVMPNSGGNPSVGPFGGGNSQGNQNRDQRPGNPPAYTDTDRNRYRNDDQYRPNYRDSDYYRRYGHAFGVDQAVRVCEQSVLTQAARRFRTSPNEIHFHHTAVDDNPGRNDWVNGSVDVHRAGREQRFGFSCSVNFDNGTVRTIELDPRPLADDPRWH